MAAVQPERTPLPCTLLSGFLGSGKTTLLKHILENTKGLRCAVLVNDMAEVNVDASLIRDGALVEAGSGSLVEMQNGCICCTLREDLLVEIARLARTGKFDYLVIESTGVSEPMQVAEAFTFDSEDAGVAQLSDISTLDTCVTVIDAANFTTNWNSVETVLDVDTRRAVGGTMEVEDTEDEAAEEPAREATDEDERTIVNLLVDQIEFANVIILNKVSSATGDDLQFIRGLLKRLNPNAEVIETDYSKVPLKRVVNTKLFDFTKAADAPGWLQELRGAHVPETLEYGISSFVYRARRPFHPGRLHDFLDEHFILVYPLDDDAGEEEEVPDMIAKRSDTLAKAKARFGTVLRSKGFMWVAHEPTFSLNWSHAGAVVNVEVGHPWFGGQDLSQFPPDAREAIENDFDGEHGDRRQELVFIGASMDKAALTECLNACLLNDEEWELGLEVWVHCFEHKWPAWLVEEEGPEGAAEDAEH